MIPQKILVVEEDRFIRKTVTTRLRIDGYQIIEASEGYTASNKIAHENFDLLVTAIMLPFYSGLELINMTKELKGKKFPILVLSKIDAEDMMAEAFKLGADDYMSRPFSPIEL
jgi:DNA-binding response OmpR family regulator